MNNLQRFINAHNANYEIALKEIKNGYKKTHWMWYIFPQIKGLGSSPVSNFYAIKTIEEAKAYLNNDILRQHLIEISENLLELNYNIEDILDYPDNMKLKSSMTLFNYIEPKIDTFKKVLDKFYDGKQDEKILNILQKNAKK